MPWNPIHIYHSSYLLNGVEHWLFEDKTFPTCQFGFTPRKWNNRNFAGLTRFLSDVFSHNYFLSLLKSYIDILRQKHRFQETDYVGGSGAKTRCVLYSC